MNSIHSSYHRYSMISSLNTSKIENISQTKGFFILIILSIIYGSIGSCMIIRRIQSNSFSIRKLNRKSKSFRKTINLWPDKPYTEESDNEDELVVNNIKEESLIYSLYNFILILWNEIIIILFNANNYHKEETVTDIEKQTEESYKTDTIWSFIHSGNLQKLKELVQADPSVLLTRGPVGEVPLHLCFLYNSPIQLEMAWFMIEINPDIILAVYTGTEYTGENVLHIAIVNQRFDLVKKLIAIDPRLMRATATGNFFKFGQACYYGEFPLAFAAATNQLDIFDFLIESGANIDRRDSNGNNILHIIVIHDLEDTYTHVKNKWVSLYGLQGNGKRKGERGSIPLWTRINKQGFTPLKLCAYLGLKDMFNFLLEEQKQIQWSYGPVTCLLYPLDELDIAFDDEDQEFIEYFPNQVKQAKYQLHSHESALELIINREHFDLLTHPRIRDLINKKWESFAYRAVMTRLIVVILFLMTFTTFSILRENLLFNLDAMIQKCKICTNLHDITSTSTNTSTNTNTNNCYEWNQLFNPSQFNLTNQQCQDIAEQSISPNEYFFFYLTFGAVLMGALYKGMNELTEIIRNFWGYWSVTGSGFLENMLSLSFSLCIGLFTIFYIKGSEIDNLFLGLASIFGYSYLFIFLLAFRLTGPMVIMVYQMLFNDVLRFMIVYIVFLLGFGQAFFVLDDSLSFAQSMRTCLSAMLGDFDLDEYSMNESILSYISAVLLIFYIIVVSILLLNLLIAMMGDTYSKINEDAENQWQLQRTRIIFSIENEMTLEARKKLKYFVNINKKRYLQILAEDSKHFHTNTSTSTSTSIVK